MSTTTDPTRTKTPSDPAVAPPKPRILWVDDDPNIIAATQRFLRRDYEVFAAFDAHEGLVAIEQQGPFAVIISDLKMPGVDGIEFLAQAHTVSPDSVRIMLTGFADQDVAIAAVNRGQIFRFLTKPSPAEDIRAAIAAGCRQYQLVMAERELLEQTLLGSIQVMTDLLALTNPLAFTHVRTVRQLALQAAATLELPDRWKLEAAVILSQIGFVTVPANTLEKHFRGRELEGAENAMIAAHPKITKDLLARIPRLEDVAEIIALHGTSRNSEEVRARQPLALAAHILRSALDLHRLEARGMSRAEALRQLGHHDEIYAPEVLRALAAVRLESGTAERHYLFIDELKNGMTIDEDVTTSEGMLLVPRGLTVNHAIRQRLRNFRLQDEIAEKLWVKVHT
ncbi:MAG: HD domain-containing phosphohydrolase [Opitutales bacterium]